MSGDNWNPLSYFQEMGTLPKALLLVGFIFLVTTLGRGASFYDRMLPASLAFIFLSLALHYFSEVRKPLSDTYTSVTFIDRSKMWTGIVLSVVTIGLLVLTVLIPNPTPKVKLAVTGTSHLAELPKPSDSPVSPPTPPSEKREKSADKNGNSANGTQATGDKSTAVGHINQGPCSIVQAGGKDNQAATNCGPPSLVLTPHTEVVPSDQKGFIKTLIRVVPNVDVAAPVNVVMTFDNPVRSVGVWIEGASGLMGGGPASVSSGTNPVIPLGTGFNSKHALLLTVYSASAVKLLDIHTE